MGDGPIPLSDGRTLAYTGLGAADGPVAMYFHETPMRQHDVVPEVWKRHANGIVISSIAPLIGAGVWLVVILGRLRSVNESWWIARDDAVITLSHAKNAADHGSIGVSPGGDRVEGFSSPLQFAVAYALQVVRSIDYRSLTMVLVVFAVATAGLLCVIGFRAAACQAGWSGRGANIVALASATAVAVIIAASWTATGWIGSGMENPLIVTAGVGVACGGWLSARHPRASAVLLVVSLSALGLSRVELVALMLPLFAAVGVLVWEQRRNWRWPVTLVGVPVLTVGLVHVGRRLYFGEWLPNTAVVQERSTGLWDIATILLIAGAFGAVLARGVVHRHVANPDLRRLAALACSASFLIFSAVLVWASATGRSGGPLDRLALFAPFLALAVIAALAFLVGRYLGQDDRMLNYVLVALVMVPIGQFLATGEARLDEFRVAGVAVAFLGLLICSLTLDAVAAIRFGDPAAVPPKRFGVGVLGVSALVAAGGVAWMASSDTPRPLNYEIGWADDVIGVVEEVRDRDLGGAGLPILANTDLGKASYSKTAVMVDLGLLGDPLLTRVKTENPELVTTYLIEVASPDVINTQKGWSCEYEEWLESATFAATYVVSELRETTGNESCPQNGAFVIWERHDGGAEYELTRALLTAPDPTELVTAAVGECAADGLSPFRCQSVRRSIQRAAETLRRRGTLDDAVAALSASPSIELDRPMLERNAGWGSAAHSAFVHLADS